MKNHKFPFNWLQIFIISVLLLGIFFRFVNLDKKVYWIEETATSVRISGYTWAEIDKELGYYDRVGEVGVEDLQKYQRPTPEKGFINTVKGLAAEEPQLPPLYFSLVKLWAQLFGNTVAVIRSLSALISLLVFPGIYWLCLELFESSLVGWIAIALVAISPFHLIFAQEARPYSIFAVNAMFSSALLLRAMRINTKPSWAFYGTTIPLGLYSHAFFGLVAIGHGIYVILLERFRLNKKLISYLIASMIGVIFFLPWVFIIITNYAQVSFTTSWAQQDTGGFGGLGTRIILIAKWMRNIAAAFLDADPDQKIINLGFENILVYFIQLAVVLILVNLVIYSIYFVCRHAPKRVWLFILPFLGVTALLLMLPDLMNGTTRSSVPRYFTPCYLGIQLTVSYLIATKISNISSNFWRQVWRGVFVALISCGIISGIAIANAESWWTKYESYYDLQMARIVNQAEKPLLICGSFEAIQRALPMSYLLEPKTRIQLVMNGKEPQISPGYSDVFLFRPYPQLLEKIKTDRKYQLEPAYKYVKTWLGRADSGVLLWQLKGGIANRG